MTSETGGGGDGPANDNVDVPEAANDNVDAAATEAGGGGEGPNEGGPTGGELEGVEDPNEPADDNVAPGEPAADGSEYGGEGEARDSNDAGERAISILDAFGLMASLFLSDAGYNVQNQIDLVKENLYEMHVTVSAPEPGDAPIMRAVSPEEQALVSQLQDLLPQAEEIERAEKEQELGDAAPEPKKPRPPAPPAPKLPGLDQRSRESRHQAANDNDKSGGGDAPNEIDE